MISHSELLAAIRLGEDTRYEFKAVALSPKGKLTQPDPKKLADEIAALANTRGGGRMILGVQDKPRKVIGLPLEQLDDLEARVAQLCTDSIEPTLAPGIFRMEVADAAGDQKPVLALDIPQSLYVHRSPGGYFYRVGSQAKQIPPEQLARLMQQRTQSRLIRFDETPVPRTSPHHINHPDAQRFLREGDVMADRLERMKLLKEDDGGALRLSVAGALLLTPEPRAWVDNAYIQCVAYSGLGKDADDQLDSLDAVGPLNQQIEEAFIFVRRNQRTAAQKIVGRQDQPQYSLRAVFEALVNAAAHRDYSIAGQKIQVLMFADRLEIISPGALPNTMAVETMPELTNTRNELLVSMLNRYYTVSAEVLADAAGRAKFIETRGEGVGIIQSESRKLSGRMPEYQTIGEAALKLTIWAAQPTRAAPENF